MKKNLLPKILLPLLLTGLYFFSRLQNVLAIPVFADEAIYIRWSQIIASVETLRFIPLTDGKQPLFMWVLVAIFKIIDDPLLAGRFLSILSGFGSMLLLGIITPIVADFQRDTRDPLKFSLEAFNRHTFLSSFSMLLYISLPFTFFFDRLSLPDNLLSLFGLLSLLMALLLAKFCRLDLSLICGMVLGLAWLTKSPAIYFIALMGGTYMFFNFRRLSKVYLPLISAILAFFIYNILRLGPQFHMISIRNRDYVWSLSDIARHPLDPLLPHISDIISIYTQYISLPILIISLVGILLVIFNKKDRLSSALLVVLAWWLAPLVANAAIAKVFTARYILYTTPALIILITFGFQGFIYNTYKIFTSRVSQVLLIIISFFINYFWIYRISFNPYNSTLPSTETGYLRDWTSGWGIKPAADFLKTRSQVSNVIVGTEGYFGTLPDGLQIYTQNTPRLTVFGVGLDLTNIPEKLIDAKNHGDEVYMLFNSSRLKLIPKDQDKVELVNSMPKPGNDSLDLYRLK